MQPSISAPEQLPQISSLWRRIQAFCSLIANENKNITWLSNCLTQAVEKTNTKFRHLSIFFFCTIQMNKWYPLFVTVKTTTHIWNSRLLKWIFFTYYVKVILTQQTEQEKNAVCELTRTFGCINLNIISQCCERSLNRMTKNKSDSTGYRW